MVGWSLACDDFIQAPPPPLAQLGTPSQAPVPNQQPPRVCEVENKCGKMRKEAQGHSEGCLKGTEKRGAATDWPPSKRGKGRLYTLCGRTGAARRQAGSLEPCVGAMREQWINYKSRRLKNREKNQCFGQHRRHLEVKPAPKISILPNKSTSPPTLDPYYSTTPWGGFPFCGIRFFARSSTSTEPSSPRCLSQKSGSDTINQRFLWSS